MKMNTVDKVVFIVAAVFFLLGMFYTPFRVASFVLLFLWVLVIWFLVIFKVLPAEAQSFFVTRKARKIETERRRNIRKTTEPKIFYGVLDNYHAQGMSEVALILATNDDAESIVGLCHEDYLKIYSDDGSVLWEGMIDMSTESWLKWQITRKSLGPTQKDIRQSTWKSWFYNVPALRAELTRYFY